MENTHLSWRNEDCHLDEVEAICLGTGRFLRAVLVPALLKAEMKPPVLVQPRGTSFYRFIEQQSDSSYPVDTVEYNGTVSTQRYLLSAVYSMGTQPHARELLDDLSRMKSIKVLGVGVTEAGLSSSSTSAMINLWKILQALSVVVDSLVVVNTDNVPMNGDIISQHMADLSKGDVEMQKFLEGTTFCNSMVDCIVSHREGDPLVPKAEPCPLKSLVVHGNWDKNCIPKRWADGSVPGVIVRSANQELERDIDLKLTVANATHTAVAHAMALEGIALTSEAFSSSPIWMELLETIVHHDIFLSDPDTEQTQVWRDWRMRLLHPHFGLSTFFITQSGPTKYGIRLGPTINRSMEESNIPSVAMAWSWACLFRWLTPMVGSSVSELGYFKGYLEHKICATDAGAKRYADEMKYNLHEGWYNFQCATQIDVSGSTLSVSNHLKAFAVSQPQPSDCLPIVLAYMLASDGGNLQSKNRESLDIFAFAVSTLYSRMLTGDGLLKLISEMSSETKLYTHGLRTLCSVLVEGQKQSVPERSNLLHQYVSLQALESTVRSEVASARIIDLHTHLLTPSHGPLCLWGINELLTYHYLVAEYFITAPPDVTPEQFYRMHKPLQADLIWRALFCDRTPLPEACRGVVTVLQALGLEDLLKHRDLAGIRKFYSSFREEGKEGVERFSSFVLDKAGIEYNIMTNIPFNQEEAKYWRGPMRMPFSPRYRAALRVYPLLSGDTQTVNAALVSSGYPITLEGARQYLRDWCDTMKPEYLMASTPHNFVLFEGNNIRSQSARGINPFALNEPGDFAVLASTIPCSPDEHEAPSVIDETSDLLTEVLMKVCEERDLPVGLKIGARRRINPNLGMAGDGLVWADASVLARMCSNFPKVRFVATFLSRSNQHEACVLASKFRNLHLYGCWWYCNTPTLIREITSMRFELLGTAFTAQHSDARVFDQLLYKWPHSRAVIADVLVTQYGQVVASGWPLRRIDIRRDVLRI